LELTGGRADKQSHADGIDNRKEVYTQIDKECLCRRLKVTNPVNQDEKNQSGNKRKRYFGKGPGEIERGNAVSSGATFANENAVDEREEGNDGKEYGEGNVDGNEEEKTKAGH